MKTMGSPGLVLKIPLSKAEKLKVEEGSAFYSPSHDGEIIDLGEHTFELRQDRATIVDEEHIDFPRHGSSSGARIFPPANCLVSSENA